MPIDTTNPESVRELATQTASSAQRCVESYGDTTDFDDVVACIYAALCKAIEAEREACAEVTQELFENEESCVSARVIRSRPSPHKENDHA